MSGLEKILNEIHSDAERESREILEKARTEEKDILARAEKEAAEVKAAAQEKGKSLTATLRERSQSSAALRVRQRMLREKQSLVQETLALAEKQLLERPAAEYFGNLLTLLKQAVQPGAGILYLSARDLERLPEGFSKQMEAIAAEKGGSLRLASDPGRSTAALCWNTAGSRRTAPMLPCSPQSGSSWRISFPHSFFRNQNKEGCGWQQTIMPMP